MAENKTSNLSKICGELSELSDRANKAASRVAPVLVVRSADQHQAMASFTSDVKDDRIRYLEAEVERLRAENQSLRMRSSVEEPVDKELTDEQISTFMREFKPTLENKTLDQLSKLYSKSNLSEYPRPVRFLISSILVEHAQAKNFSPLPCWFSAVASNGALS